MMKRLILLLNVCMLAWTSMAQQLDAKSLLDKAVTNLRANEGIQASVTITALEEDETDATICLKGDKFVMETESMKVWFDGTSQWTYLKANEEVTVTTPTVEELQLLNPYALLSSYQTGYNLALIGNHQNKSFYDVQLKAKDNAQPFQIVVLTLNKKNLHPIRAKMKPQGATNEIAVTITAYHTKKQYLDSYFQFKATDYPLVEVIDLR